MDAQSQAVAGQHERLALLATVERRLLGFRSRSAPTSTEHARPTARRRLDRPQNALTAVWRKDARRFQLACGRRGGRGPRPSGRSRRLAALACDLAARCSRPPHPVAGPRAEHAAGLTLGDELLSALKTGAGLAGDAAAAVESVAGYHVSACGPPIRMPCPRTFPRRGGASLTTTCQLALPPTVPTPRRDAR